MQNEKEKDLKELYKDPKKIEEQDIDYKNLELLKSFISETGSIIPARVSKLSSIAQRKLAKAIKRARFLALLPYCDLHFN